MICLSLPAQAATEENLHLNEQKIKAGLLYNFLKYTEWPPESMADTAAPLTVCIFGDDPFGGQLEPMQGRSVNQRVIEVKRVDTLDDTENCHLVVLHADDSRGPELLRFLADKSVVTVSDAQGFANSGGMIEFVRRNEHIGVDLNMDALTAAQLRVQDRLLKLVTVVHGAPEGK